MISIFCINLFCEDSDFSLAVSIFYIEIKYLI